MIKTFKMSKNDYSGIGMDIVHEGIFKRFPELVPYVGENYSREDGKHKKLLFVGNSNYFDKELVAVSVFQNAKEWYTGATDKLIPENKKQDVNCAKYYHTLNRAFNVANEVLKKIEPGDEKWPLHETAFYNYFLRPALNLGKGKSKEFKPEPIDREVAGAALCGIIECLQPHVIVFFRKPTFIAFDEYRKNKNLSYDNLQICWTYHPASPRWWHGAYGRNHLEEILRKHWLPQ